MITIKHLENFKNIETPFYFYDMEVLKKTISSIKNAAPKEYHIHYALKANAHPELLKLIKEKGWQNVATILNEFQIPRAQAMLRHIEILRDPNEAYKDPAFLEALDYYKSFSLNFKEFI